MVRPKQRKRYMRFVTRKFKSLYRADPPRAAARELARYKLDSLSVQGVRWDREGRVRAADFNFFPWKRKTISSVGNRNFLYTTE